MEIGLAGIHWHWEEGRNPCALFDRWGKSGLSMHRAKAEGQDFPGLPVWCFFHSNRLLPWPEMCALGIFYAVRFSWWLGEVPERVPLLLLRTDQVKFRTPTAAPVFLFHKGGTLNCWRTPDLVGPLIRCVIVVRIK